jgi:dephospho-CoA kinase
MEKKLIALLGMPGSGKTEVIEYLQETRGWPKVYFGQITMDEIRERGLPFNNENERIVREDLRLLHGKEYYAKKIIEKIDAMQDSQVVLVESLYSWTEYRVLKERYGSALHTIAVIASPEVRYQRLSVRPKRPLTKEEAYKRDIAQIELLEQGGPIALADAYVPNEKDRDSLHREIDGVVSRIIGI